MIPWPQLFELTPRDTQTTRLQRVREFRVSTASAFTDTFTVPLDRVFLLQHAYATIRPTAGSTVTNARITLFDPGQTTFYEIARMEGLPSSDETVYLGSDLFAIGRGAVGSNFEGLSLTPKVLNFLVFPEESVYWDWNVAGAAGQVITYGCSGLLIPRGNFTF